MDSKKERKAHKKAYKKARRKFIQPWKIFTILCLVVTLITTPVGMALKLFDNTAVLFLGGTFWELVDEDPNAIYYESDFATEQERNEAEQN